MASIAIRFKEPITPVIRMAGKNVPNCGTSDNPPAAGFRYREYGVVIYPKEITVLGTENKNIAGAVMDLLRDIEARENTGAKDD